MKALSLKQPFAELIVSGRKTIELRKWNTRFRGRFFIHASKTVDTAAMKQFGFTTLPTGGIVGEAELVSVRKYTDDAAFEQDNGDHLAHKGFGPYGFILRNALRRPLKPMNGKLNFWEVTA